MMPVVRRELYSRSHGITMLFLAFGVQLSQDYLLLLPRHDPFKVPPSFLSARNHLSGTTTHHTLIHPAQSRLGLIAMDSRSFKGVFALCILRDLAAQLSNSQRVLLSPGSTC